MTDTSELDCITDVATSPKERLLGRLLVDRLRSLSRIPPVNAVNPSSRNKIPKRKMAMPAAMTLKSALIHIPQPKRARAASKNQFLYKVLDAPVILKAQ